MIFLNQVETNHLTFLVKLKFIKVPHSIYLKAYKFQNLYLFAGFIARNKE